MWRKIRVIREMAAEQLLQALDEVAAQVNRKLVA
jgi:hypothetical protein